MNMLKTMRNMSSLKLLLWIIVISFIAAMFTVWGTGGGSGSGGRTWLGDEYAVKVESSTLPPAVFRLQYRYYIQRLRDMLGESYRDDFVRGASKTVADGMIRNLILADMAKSYGLGVSDEELAADIQRMYNFQDPRKEYPAMISRMGVTAQEFETLLRYEVLSQKLTDLLADAAYLPESEVKRLYTEQNEGVKAMVAVVSNGSFTGKISPVTDLEIQARFDRDKAKFQIPEKRAMEYISATQSSIRNGLKVDDAQVRAYYDSHLSEYSTPANQRQASHILIKVDEKAPAQELDAARKKAQEAFDKAKAGGDFATLARQYSQDGSSAQGGDLGWFDRTRMVKPFGDAVFDQCKAVGDVVGPVQSQFGFHVVKLTGIGGGSAKPFESVKAQARQALLYKDPATAERVKGLLAQAEKDLGEAKDEAALKSVAAKYGLTVTPAGAPFAKGDPVPGFGQDPAIQEAVYKASQGQWSGVIKTRDGVVRLKVATIVPAHQAKLDEVKNKIAGDLRQERSSALARAAAQFLAASAKDAASLETEAKKAAYPVQQSALLKAADAIPGAGNAPEVNKALLAARPGSVVGPLEGPNGWVVAVVTEHAAVDPQKFAQEKDTFARNQRTQSAQAVMDDYVERRRAALEKEKKISYNQELLDGMEPASGRQAS